jgi:thiamine biosynthesis lipoprotein
LRQSLEAARSSGGRFDPTVLDALEASGYRRSLEELGDSVHVQPLMRRPDYRQVVLRRDGAVVLKNGAHLDLGGFAKGWTIDRASDVMQPCESWVVNAGGDLRAVGPGPNASGWLVGIEDPFRPDSDIGGIRVRDGAVATSTAARRRWHTPAGWAHHLIDPATGMSAATGLLSVTVVAATATDAEVLAKTVFLMGMGAGLSYIESRDGCGAVLVPEQGMPVWSLKMEELREY